MKNVNDHVELENYLREFQPVEPRPLPPVRKRVPLIWAAVFAGALLVLAIFAIRIPRNVQGLPTFKAEPTTPPSGTPAPDHAVTLRKLNAAAQQGDPALELELFRNASMVLPRMDRPNTALNALSGE